MLIEKDLKEIGKEVSECIEEIMKEAREQGTYEIVIEINKVYKKYPDGRKEFIGRC